MKWSQRRVAAFAVTHPAGKVKVKLRMSVKDHWRLYSTEQDAIVPAFIDTARVPVCHTSSTNS